MFLARVPDPAVTDFADSAFRVIMFTDLTQRLSDDAALAVLRQHNSRRDCAVPRPPGRSVSPRA